MLLANFGHEFIKMFTTMHWAVVTLLAIGVIFCLIEAAIPGFGVFGILGIGSVIASIIVHAIISGSVVQVFIFIILTLFVVFIIFAIFIRSAKHGLLAKSALVENKSSIPRDYKEKAVNKLKPLIGQEGVTLTECRPVGKILIGANSYEAQSVGNLIQKGELIKVVAIEDARIMIDQISIKN